MQVTRIHLLSKYWHRHGFTLIDVTVAVLITGILASVAAPAFTGFLQHARAEAAAKRIRADLDLARRTAISQSQAQVVQFSVGSGLYVIPGIAHLDHPGQTYSVNVNMTPYSSTIKSAILGSDTGIKFNRFGVPDSGGQITVTSGMATQTVTIDPDTGKASVP